MGPPCQKYHIEIVIESIRWFYEKQTKQKQRPNPRVKAKREKYLVFT